MARISSKNNFSRFGYHIPPTDLGIKESAELLKPGPVLPAAIMPLPDPLASQLVGGRIENRRRDLPPPSLKDPFKSGPMGPELSDVRARQFVRRSKGPLMAELKAMVDAQGPKLGSNGAALKADLEKLERLNGFLERDLKLKDYVRACQAGNQDG